LSAIPGQLENARSGPVRDLLLKLLSGTVYAPIIDQNHFIAMRLVFQNITKLSHHRANIALLVEKWNNNAEIWRLVEGR
jgi:hypothetical protein